MSVNIIYCQLISLRNSKAVFEISTDVTTKGTKEKVIGVFNEGDFEWMDSLNIPDIFNFKSPNNTSYTTYILQNLYIFKSHTHKHSISSDLLNSKENSLKISESRMKELKIERSNSGRVKTNLEHQVDAFKRSSEEFKTHKYELERKLRNTKKVFQGFYLTHLSRL